MVNNIYYHITQAGVDKNLTKQENKRIILLNRLAVLGGLANLLLAVGIPLIESNWNLMFAHLATIPLLSVCIFLQKKNRFQIARVLFWSINFGLVVAMAKILKTDIHNEYYFGLIGVLSLLFTNNKWITHGLLLICILTFYGWEIVETFLHGIHNTPKMGNSAMFLFTLHYLVVNYFKKLNIQNENALEKEKDEVIKRQELIERQKAELEELNQFKSNYFINISHEIRTPLTILRGTIKQLQQEHGKNAKKEELILKQADKINQILNDLIDVSRLEENKLDLNLQPVEINLLINRIAENTASLFEEKNIHFDCKTLSKSIFVSVDNVLFERAITNILFNAYKYTKEGGRVSIILQIQRQDLLIIISDNGIGIDEKNIPLIFEKYHQERNEINRKGGSGIGLFYAKKIVELNHGKINLNSQLGKGTEFSIQLPYTPDHSKKVKPIAAAAQDNPAILIVDDHEEIRNYIQDILSDFNTCTAANGKEALSIILRRNIQLLITDLMMPIMSGNELIEQLQKNKIHIPIVVLTARTDNKIKTDLFKQGIANFLSKPFHDNELLAIVNQLLHSQIAPPSTKEEVLTENELLLNKFTTYVLEHIGNFSYSIPEVANNLGITERTFHRKVKQATGYTPNHYIRKIKMEKAKELIMQEKFTTIKQISMAVGIKNQTYFSKIYEEHFGEKPSFE